MKKNLKHLRECTDPMDKFMCLSGLQDRNETIFFKLLIENMEELGEAAALHSRTTPSSSASSLTDLAARGFCEQHPTCTRQPSASCAKSSASTSAVHVVCGRGLERALASCRSRAVNACSVRCPAQACTSQRKIVG